MPLHMKEQHSISLYKELFMRDIDKALVLQRSLIFAGKHFPNRYNNKVLGYFFF